MVFLRAVLGQVGRVEHLFLQLRLVLVGAGLVDEPRVVRRVLVRVHGHHLPHPVDSRRAFVVLRRHGILELGGEGHDEAAMAHAHGPGPVGVGLLVFELGQKGALFVGLQHRVPVARVVGSAEVECEAVGRDSRDWEE